MPIANRRNTKKRQPDIIRQNERSIPASNAGELTYINNLNLTIFMAEIKPMALIESMKKKVCEHSDVYFRTNKKTGKVYTGKLCNPSTKEPSAAQTAAKARFAKVSAAVRAILAGSSEQKTQLVAEYNAQNKIGSLFGYAMKKLNGNYDQNGDLING